MKKLMFVLAALLVAQIGFGADWPTCMKTCRIDEPCDTSVSASGSTYFLYRLYVSPDVPSHAKVPLVIYLHGEKDRGWNNTEQLKDEGRGIKDIIDFSEANHIPMVLLAPQCYPMSNSGTAKSKETNAVLAWMGVPKWSEACWNEYYDPSNEWNYRPATSSQPMGDETRAMQYTMKVVHSLLEGTNSNCQVEIDADRIYAAGFSMGAFGVWEMLQRYPDLLAAAVPVSGGGDTEAILNAKDVPVWSYHYAGEQVVSVEMSRIMVNALKEGGHGNIRYRELSDEEFSALPKPTPETEEWSNVDYIKEKHYTYKAAFSDPVVLDWLFSQRKRSE